MNRLLLFVLAFMVVSGCSNSVDEVDTSIRYYFFSSTVIDAVEQKEPIELEHGLAENYTMPLKNFIPTGKQFDLFNKHYNEDSESRLLSVPSETKFFRLSHDKREKVSISIEEFLSELKQRKEVPIEFWASILEVKQQYNVPPNYVNNYLVANEIHIILQ